MKRFIITAWLMLGASPASYAQAVTNTWGPNVSSITNPAEIPLTMETFINQGTIALDMVTAGNSTNPTYTAIPFSTGDTLYYTNKTPGVMTSVPGFIFQDRTSGALAPSASFYNSGTIIGYDYPEFPDVYGSTQNPEYSQPIGSQVQISATNVVDYSGSISVGNAGNLTVTGQNVNLASGTLIAGAVNTGGPFVNDPQLGVNNSPFDPLDTTGTPGPNGDTFDYGSPFFVDPPGVNDLLWSVTPHNPVVNMQNLAAELTPPLTDIVTPSMDDVLLRKGTPIYDGVSLSFNTNAIYEPFVFSGGNAFTGSGISTNEISIVMVNTNFIDENGQPDPNITASVNWGGWSVTYSGSTASISDQNAPSVIVQFSESVTDVVTEQVVTNAVYLLDMGQVLSMILYTNAETPNSYCSPSVFEVTTSMPTNGVSWLNAYPTNFFEIPYTPNLIFTNGYAVTNVTIESSIYGVQIGRNPGQVDGHFNGANGFGSTLFGGELNVPLLDPTNEGAVIDLSASDSLALANSFLRAEGIVVLNATNITGQPTGKDWGQMNVQLGATGGALTISNLFTTNFSRLRGNIYAWCGTWTNLYTNGPTTNYNNIHLLVVDQNLGGNFQSAIRNLNLSAATSINIQDPLYVINDANFNTASLTFNSNSVFTQNAGNLTSTNMPGLQELFVNSNGSLSVDSLLIIGNTTTTLPTVGTASYSVESVTNLGTITAGTPYFQARYFENDGVINGSNSISIGSTVIGMGLVLTNANNSLVSQGSITLSAPAMEFTNTQIVAGGVNGAGLGSIELDTTANGLITDFKSGAPSTNTYSTNIWLANDGFVLAVKPAYGDLYGTEIISVATNNSVVTHVWAGVDWGTNAAGFLNNMVIGHLRLSRQSTNGILHFTGAGSQNGMYVDYLDLDPNSLSYSDYTNTNALVIDPNLTIYFAASDVDPYKLEAHFPGRLVWVTNFSGPNSTAAVPYYNSTNVCLMNSSLAYSTDPELSFFPGTINYDDKPYVLNDPSNPAIFIPCPSNIANSITWPTNFAPDFGTASTTSPLATTFTTNYIIPGTNSVLEFMIDGQGAITPKLKDSQIAIGKRYTLTAVPMPGWVFAGWTVIGMTNGIDTNLPVLKFTLEGGLTNIAHFVNKEFTLAKGTYHGLFMDPTNAPTTANAGAFNFTLGANGVLSGRLVMGADAFTFASTVQSNGLAVFNATHAGRSIPVSLQVDLSGMSNNVIGWVINSNILLSGDLAPTATLYEPYPMTNYGGRYTLVLTNCGTNTFTNMVTNVVVGAMTNSVTNSISNYYGPLTSYATVLINKQGVLAAAGKLSDGKSFSQSVPISRAGRWPFYVYVPGGADYLLGWISFNTNIGKTIVATNIFWDKGATKSLYYPEGFTNTVTMTTFGASYGNPESKGSSLPPSGVDLTNPELILGGAGLGESTNQIVYPLDYNGKLSYSDENLTLNINPVTGYFSGQLKDSGGIQFSGVVLQGTNNDAYGFFLNPNDPSSGAGSVLLQSSP